ncbi:bacteriocin-like protein [Chryseobacterium sp. MMS23-Vi53]|uniref:bacteriocin-like protein n=1 Tax=Chryseobacterium sp. MMS23-Vi53 TaxID=3386644 RepID=UPI0039E86AB0
MKNLKKLNRDELRTISGAGLLDNVLGVVNGTVGTVGGIVNGVGGVVGGVVNGVGSTLGATVNGTVTVLENGLCQVQCVLNGVISVHVLSCGAASC